MRSVSRLVAFVLMGFLLVLPVLGADDKDKKDDAKKTAKTPAPKKAEMKNMARDPEAAKDKALRSGVITVRVAAVIEDKKTLRLHLTIPYLKLNTGALQSYQQAQLSMLRRKIISR